MNLQTLFSSLFYLVLLSSFALADTPTTVKLKWDHPDLSTIASFRIYACVGPITEGSGETAPSCEGSMTIQMVEGKHLSTGMTYMAPPGTRQIHYRVMAIDLGGKGSGLSEEAIFTINQPPDKPTNLTIEVMEQSKPQ